MTAAEVLRAARERISDPERWCKDDFARDPSGEPIPNPLSPDACCWCAAGAIFWAARVDPTTSFPVHPEALDVLADVIGGRRSIDDPGEDVAWFNDAPTTTHADVLRLFDAAIAKAEAA